MRKPDETIASRQNALVKLTASLTERKYRTREGLFRFDGQKLFVEALQKGLPLFAVLFRASAAPALLAAAEGLDVPRDCRVALLADDLFDRLSEEKSPDGVICVSKTLDKIHKFATIDISDAKSEGLILLLESVRDPGNLGTILRSARAFGVGRVILSADCADLYHPRTVRAAMGALFCQPVSVVTEFSATVAALAEKGRVFAAALTPDAVPLDRVTWRRGDAVIVGNEGHGLSPAVLAACTHRLLIPMTGDVESLNAGVAASVILWDYARGGDLRG